MNSCQKETSSERYRRKQQELQDKINKMSSEEKIAYENEKRKKQDEANFRHREERRLFKQAKARRLEFKSWKKCAHCGENKLIQDFYSKDEYCKECRNQYYPKKKYKPKYPNNKDGKIKRFIDERRHLYRDYTGTNEEFIEKITREKFADWKREFFELEKQEIEEEKKLNGLDGISIKNKTPLQIFKEQVRANVKASLKSHQVKKDNKTIEIIRCSFEELQKHLEETWEKNYGTKYNGEEVHIDHIIPLASANTRQEVINLCYWTNLQYLLPHDNFTKHDKMPDELEKENFYENIKNNYQASLIQKEEF